MILWGKKYLVNEMHMPLGDYHVIAGPSVLLWGLA